jgi:hypothetical protein
MLTTTNNWRAYIRRNLAISWSSSARARGQELDGAVEQQMGMPGLFRKGLAPQVAC